MRWFWCATTNFTLQSVKSFMIQTLGLHIWTQSITTNKDTKDTCPPRGRWCAWHVSLSYWHKRTARKMWISCGLHFGGPVPPPQASPTQPPKKSFSPTKQWPLKFFKMKNNNFINFSITTIFFFSQFDRLIEYECYIIIFIKIHHSF